MAIDKEVLNDKLVVTEVHTGVFMAHDRRVCVVVRVTKEGIVDFMHFDNCTVQLTRSFKEKFMRDYPLELYHYPAMRALRMFWKLLNGNGGSFSCTTDARAVLRSVLKQG